MAYLNLANLDFGPGALMEFVHCGDLLDGLTKPCQTENMRIKTVKNREYQLLPT